MPAHESHRNAVDPRLLRPQLLPLLHHLDPAGVEEEPRQQPDDDPIVTRSVYAEVPPWVEYGLTPVANTLIPHAVTLASWAVESNPETDAHPSAYGQNEC